MKDKIDQKIASLQKRCDVKLHQRTDKITLHIKDIEYRITAFLDVSNEYKFPMWNAPKTDITEWFWNWVDLEDIESKYRTAMSEVDSHELFLKTRHTLEKTPIPDKAPEKKWACIRCGSYDHRSPDAPTSKICAPCKTAAYVNAQKLRNEHIEQQRKERKRLVYGKNLEKPHKEWRCVTCNSDKRPAGRYAKKCRKCNNKDLALINETKVS